MILYHGSNILITEIDLSKGRKGKDFGCGFYLSDNIEQALSMAKAVALRNGNGSPVVSAFDFDETLMDNSNELAIKKFSGYTKEWAEFILLNRKNKTNVQAHPYDIVYGPIADDRVGVQIRRYLQQYITIDILIHELSFKTPTNQYFFGTEHSIRYLKPMGEQP